MIGKKILPTLLFFLCGISVNAQEISDNQLKEYLNEAGDYATIYNGELEVGYDMAYKELPYYISPEFTLGDIVYKGNKYSSLPLKLDWYKDELIVLTPEKRFSKVVIKENVNEVRLHGHLIIYYTSPISGDLKNGYYLQLIKEEDITLLAKTLCIHRSSKRIFEKRTYYYLLYNGKHYSVSKKKDFVRVFPQFKKEINKYTKELKLKFNKNSSVASLKELAAYCQMLLFESNK